MLFWLNPKLALFTLIPVPLVFLGTWVFWRKVYPRYYRLWDASAKQMVALSGMLSGIRVVKAFAQEEREIPLPRGETFPPIRSTAKACYWVII